MIAREPRARPNSWAEHRQSIRPSWALPWYAIDFAFQWTAWLLSKWAFLEVLEYLGIFSVLFAASGGRVEALQEPKREKSLGSSQSHEAMSWTISAWYSLLLTRPT